MTDKFILKLRSLPVDPLSSSTASVARELCQYISYKRCAAVSAIQLSRPESMFAAVVPSNITQVSSSVVGLAGDEDESKKVRIGVFLNPSIVEILSEEIFIGVESCLSFPGKKSIVARHADIRVEYQILGSSDVYQADLHDDFAQVFQHECDHTMGKTLEDVELDEEDLQLLESSSEFDRNLLMKELETHEDYRF